MNKLPARKRKSPLIAQENQNLSNKHNNHSNSNNSSKSILMEV